jgi:purine catabolism regulator
VLGALLAYDAAHDSRLVQSLRVFLEENRSWQRAAARLIIHKQTLVYRMERVEQITGRRLDRIADVTELWLALQAAAAAGLLDPSD